MILESPEVDLKDCACKGYGFQPGTMTSDSWGEPCECGREQHRPKCPRECVELEEIHAKAHAKRLAADFMKTFDKIMEAIKQ
jgi:hypothetical protein